MVIASGGTTITDLTDSKSLSVFLSSNIPKTQIFDPNSSSYAPDWSITNLVIAPVVYVNSTLIELSNNSLTVSYGRKEGIGVESGLVDGESVSGKVLTVSANKLSSIESGLLTYIAHISYYDADMQRTVESSAQIEFTLIRSGQDSSGGSSVSFKIYTTTADTFLNGKGNAIIETQAYYGAEPITDATFNWQKLVGGIWVDYSPAQTGSSLTVDASEVIGLQVIRCTMVYDGVSYSDTITLTDKTDNYQAEIVSTSGTVFKGGIGTSCLYCNVYQNAIRVDGLKSTVFSKNAPSNAAEGDYYYKIESGSITVTLMRYTNGTWVVASGDNAHTFTYNWYRRDQDGNPLDNGAVFATGKVIYITGDYVDVKTVFVCEVLDTVERAATMITIVDTTDIVIGTEKPSNPFDGMMFYNEMLNIMYQYSATLGDWQIMSNYNQTQTDIGDLQTATTENDAYKTLIANERNVTALIDLIAIKDYLIDTVKKTIATDSVGTLMNDPAQESGSAVRVGTNGVEMLNDGQVSATLGALKATLPQGLVVGDTTHGSTIRLGNFIFEYQLSSGNLTLRKA